MKYPIHQQSKVVAKNLGEELATRDATFYISMLNSLPNPDPILRKAGQRIQVYRDLTADWEVFAAIELIHSGLKDLLWEIDPNDADQGGVDFITEMVESWDVYNIMTQCIEARGFGYQPFEAIWNTFDKKWIITELISKPPEWFNYSTKNELQFISKDHPQGKPVPEGKFIVARNRPSYNNPYGESHYSRCFWPVTFKRGGIKFLVKFLEKYGMPWVVGKQPRGTGLPETNKLLADLHNMVQDAVAVIPDDSSVDLQNNGGSSNSGSFLEFIHYCDSAINKTLLSNELSTSVSKEGGDVRGSGQTQMEVSQKVIRSVAQMAEYVINCAIDLMWAQNYTGKAPRVKIYEPKKVQKERADRDSILVNTGVKFTKKYYMDNYALAEDDFELIEKEAEDTSADLPDEFREFMERLIQPIRNFNESHSHDHSKGCQCAACSGFRQWHEQAVTRGKKPPYKKEDIHAYDESNKKSFLPKWKEFFKKLLGVKEDSFAEDAILENSNNSLDLIDQLIEAGAGVDGAEESQAHLQELLQPLLDLVNSSGSYEDILQKLAGLYPDMNSEQLEERLARAYFIADVIGRITEEENSELD
ncbi:MAG: DUF935 family protein [Balneola sp.]